MISWLATLRIALRALARNKMRSFLTALGIIIGVAAVIAMVALGEGAKAKVDQTLSAMGTNLLIVTSGSSLSSGARGGAGSQPTLSWDDWRALQSELPSVRYAAPVLRTNSEIISDSANWATTVYGTTADYFAIRNWNVASGSMITASDLSSGAKSVVLGQTVAHNLFGSGSDPVGQSVRIRNMPFTVIGVLEKKGQSGMGNDYDDAAFTPATSFQRNIQGRFGKYLTGQIYIGAADGNAIDQTIADISTLLRERHRLGGDDADDFNVRNMAEMANARAASTQTLTALLAGIALVSLLVGGIGVMNIMLVSVTERTREIGVRMAVGARGRDILAQFLAEAVLLALVGGALGIVIGVGMALLLSSYFGWPLAIRADIVVLATAVSAFVGIGFGLYPARKASRLNPIDALRYE